MGINTAEADLWCTVLMTAMIEGFHGCPGGHYATLADNSQAISFLVADTGEWAASRRHICNSLGLDEQSFVARCKAVFEGGAPPDVPGFDLRRDTRGIENQRALYRALMGGKPAPRINRPEPPKSKPKGKLSKAEPLTNVMAKAIFAAMSQPRTTTPIEVNVDGLLYWPVKAPDTGTFQGKPLPQLGTKTYRVMRVATRQRGGNLIGLYQCGEWEETLRDVADRYDLEVVHGDCRPVIEMTSETRLFLRQRL